MTVECTKCGACCIAPDIAALDKPLGLRCPHLTLENLCGVYESRPQICRDYQADDFCESIAADTIEERTANYLAAFALTADAAEVKRSGCRSMSSARKLHALKAALP